MKLYIRPDMKINMFEQEEVLTVASAATDGTVPGLDEVEAKNIRQVGWSDLVKVTKVVF